MREVRSGGGKEWIGTENRAKAGDCRFGSLSEYFFSMLEKARMRTKKWGFLKHLFLSKSC